jgi:hypothetical protein
MPVADNDRMMRTFVDDLSRKQRAAWFERLPHRMIPHQFRRSQNHHGRRPSVAARISLHPQGTNPIIATTCLRTWVADQFGGLM